MSERVMDATAMGEDVDLGGGFVLYRVAARHPIIVATALADTGALGFASPPGIDARLDADALAWLGGERMLSGRRLCSLSQIHGATCAAADEMQAVINVAPSHCPGCGAPLDPDLERCPFCDTPLTAFAVTNVAEADAIWTSSPNDMLVIRTADCAAVWLVDPENAHLAMLHAGWRGAADGIVRQTVDTLRAHRGHPESMVAAIGPHIGPCCFEVGPDVAEFFTDIDGAVAPASVLTAPRQRADSLSLNLGAVLATQLQDEGVAHGSIHLATACTRCFRSDDAQPALPSYRRNGKGGPLMASVGFLER
jgi:YfiH family protein